MPPVSRAQNAAMHAAASGNSTLGIPQKVGAEFTANQQPGQVKALPMHAHALSIASATHLHKAGHIGAGLRDAIHEKAKAAIEAQRRPQPMQAPQQAPAPFGSLAPPMPGQGGQGGGPGGY